MNVNLQSSRKAYWSKVHAIQGERNCTAAEAKRFTVSTRAANGFETHEQSC